MKLNGERPKKPFSLSAPQQEAVSQYVRFMKVMLSKAKHLAFSACDKFEILRLRLRMTARYCPHRENESGNQLRIVPVVLVVLGLLAGCRQKMADQPRYEPLVRSTFFEDGRAARPLVEGTVARGELRRDELLYTGKEGGKPIDLFPFPATLAVLTRGQQRYNIFCSPCHDRVGTGQGMIVRRGYRVPPSFHIDRLREAPAGYFFERHKQRLRCDAGLCPAGPARRPLGYCGLYPRPAVEPACGVGRRAGGSTSTTRD